MNKKIVSWSEFIVLVRKKTLYKKGQSYHNKYYLLSDILNNIYDTVEETGFTFYFKGKELYENNVWRFYYQCGDEVITSDFYGDTDQKNQVQASGSTSTYGRRYTLLELFGLSNDKDDPDEIKHHAVTKPTTKSGSKKATEIKIETVELPIAEIKNKEEIKINEKSKIKTIFTEPVNQSQKDIETIDNEEDDEYDDFSDKIKIDFSEFKD